MKKVLITYASYGMGHTKATSALGKMINDNIDVSYFNLSKYAHPYLEEVFIKFNSFMVVYLPFLYKKIYYSSYKSYNLIKWFYGNRKVLEKIKYLNPDIVIATHFISEAVLIYLKEKYNLKYKICFLLTDYHINNYVTKQLNKVDKYFVPTDEIKKDCLKLGINESRISVSSIPISNKFDLKLNKNNLLNKYGLNKNMKTILYICGGVGISKNLNYLKELLKLKQSFQFIFVAGKNKKLKRRVNNIVRKSDKFGIVIGYTDKIHELLFLSDLVVGKSGGLITSECIKLNKFMVVVSPIIGQESENAEYIESHNLGVYIRNINDFKTKMDYLLKNDISPNKIVIKYCFKEEINNLITK